MSAFMSRRVELSWLEERLDGARKVARVGCSRYVPYLRLFLAPPILGIQKTRTGDPTQGGSSVRSRYVPPVRTRILPFFFFSFFFLPSLRFSDSEPAVREIGRPWAGSTTRPETSYSVIKCNLVSLQHARTLSTCHGLSLQEILNTSPFTQSPSFIELDHFSSRIRVRSA